MSQLPEATQAQLLREWTEKGVIFFPAAMPVARALVMGIQRRQRLGDRYSPTLLERLLPAFSAAFGRINAFAGLIDLSEAEACADVKGGRSGVLFTRSHLG